MCITDDDKNMIYYCGGVIEGITAVVEDLMDAVEGLS